EEALYFAREKAGSVAAQHPYSLILASDTLIVFDGEKMGKPVDGADAVRMLKKLSGKSHTLYTSIVLLNTGDQSSKEYLEKVIVTFHALSSKQIRDYVNTGEPMGKAGAYAIQEKGKALVARIEGDEEAVVGLPLKPIRQWLLGVTSL
ncbi:MAG: Maf family protein, partial [bacterium]|nr:Maf family protein [bacterium]